MATPDHPHGCSGSPAATNDLRSLELATDRVVIRAFSPADAAETFAAITPGLTRFMSWESPPSPEAFAAVWTRWLPDIAAGTELHAAIRRRGDGAFLGLAGLHGIATAEPELGIWIRLAAHGHGYGREAVSGIAAWAAGRFGFASFVYPVAEANMPSRRLAEALGGTVVARRDDPKFRAVLYRIPASPAPAGRS